MTKDKWGRCCDHCPYFGHSYKPCRTCTGMDREISDGDILVYKGFRIGIRKWNEYKYIVFPIFKAEEFPLTSSETRFGDKVLCTHWLCTIRKTVVELLPRVGTIGAEAAIEAVRHGFGCELKEESPLEEGEPLMEKDERYYQNREILCDWLKAIAKEIDSQIEEES